MTAPAAFRTRLRRYPALGFLAVAALLASLLPSALRVPLSGPTASAELAPVPGKSDAQQGDLSALGQTSTGGLGAGRGLGSGLGGAGRSRPGDTGSAADPPPDGGGGGGRNPANKRCVGNPPRQTEDPMSPACVRFFKGDNGGATSKGVTRDEIRVVFYTTACGNITIRDVGDEADAWDRTLNRYARFFNERFQTYDRRVRLFRVVPPGRNGVPCRDNVVKAALQRIDEQLDPFYIFPGVGTSLTPRAAEEAARLGIMTSMERVPRELADRLSPWVVSHGPGLEHFAASGVGAVCARLAGRPARFHGEPSRWLSPRKFGVLYRDGTDPSGRGAALLLDGIRDRCDDAAGEVVVGSVSAGAALGDGCERGAADAFARFRLNGVTTVLLYDEPSFALTCEIPAATTSGYVGEWFNLASPFWEKGTVAFAGDHAPRFFGLLAERRLPLAFADQHHQQAARDCVSPCTPGITVYNQLLLLFTGIQAAGPRLTSANLDKGLRALPARQSRDPFAPAAYFGAGDHFFVKDYALGWWDPAGRVPGASRPGCWRLVEEGLRYRPEDWAGGPQGDAGIQQRSPEQPCQGWRNETEGS